MIPVFHHCGLYIISNMEFLFFLGNQLVYLYRPTRKYTYQIIITMAMQTLQNKNYAGKKYKPNITLFRLAT